ncbi:MAG: electron transfer flavoprotein subunit alpha/FixB family protein [Planctomycetes bacterium]|nr:electron transfer flavoprotein subunit alpha/FixB family protein [Planctomycetota bacterium]
MPTGELSDYQGVWILAEQSGGRIGRISHELLTRGRELADKRSTTVTAFVIGWDINADDLQGLIDRGADRVITMEAPQLEYFLVEPYAVCMLNVIENYRPEIIIAGATSSGRTLMPYVAVKARAGLTADCTVLDIEEGTGNLLQTRPAIGGNILATIKTPTHRPQMATVRPHSARPAPPKPPRNGEIIRLGAPDDMPAGKIRRKGFIPADSQHGLQDADIVVVTGRGVKKADNIPMMQALAETLDAALGATRDVVDRGWLSYPHQVGLSGKTVTPKLYIGAGASGSIQHLAGMQTSETIVAINIDPEAQLFNVADFGIVGDMMDVVPVLTEKLREARKQGK